MTKHSDIIKFRSFIVLDEHDKKDNNGCSLKRHGGTSLTEDGVEFKQLDEGPVRNKRGSLEKFGLWVWHSAVELRLHQLWRAG